MRFFLKPTNMNSVRSNPGSFQGSTLALIAVITITTLAFFPLLATAQGLIPCGNPGQKPCTVSDLVVLANNVIKFTFTYLVLPIVAVGILASGIMILTAGGSAGQIEKGKKMLWSLLIGFFIAAVAWLFVNTFLCAIITTDTGFRAILQSLGNFPSCTLEPAPRL